MTRTFEVTSGKMQVSDPCYVPTQDWFNQPVIDVLNGAWIASYFHDQEMGVLMAWHAAYRDPYRSSWKKLEGALAGVDSGQCGLYDFDYYQKNGGQGGYREPNSFYARACDLTDSDINADRFGVIDNRGVVSSTYWGDGCYNIYIIQNPEGVVVGVKIGYGSDYGEDE